MIHRKLAWRLYALGILQIVLVAAAVVLGAVVNGPPRVPSDPEREIAVAAARVGPLLTRTGHEDLAAEIADLRKRGMLASVYDSFGDLVASNVHPPLQRGPMGVDPRRPEPLDLQGPTPGPPPGLHSSPPPHAPPGMRAFPFRGFPFEHPVTIALGDGTEGGSYGVLVARFERPKLDLKAPLLTLSAGLLIVGVGALLMARWLVRPLQQLAKAAYSLGEGDLRARSGLLRADEVGDVGRAFDLMAERVERLVRAEKELLANVSHELRTPLARIRVALDLAQEGDAPAAREALSEIEVDLGELESLLDDVLTTARMEIEGGRVSPASFALHVEVLSPQLVGQRVSERFRARHPNRPLEIHLGSGLHPILADPVLLRRAVDNLLENAHKYSPDSTSSVELVIHARQDRVVFEVRDHGMGIAPADLAHVFDPFFRGEKSRSRGTGGVGLGLTLAKSIVEAHGGTIHVTSIVGTGTTARVELPAADEAKDGSDAERPYPYAEGSPADLGRARGADRLSRGLGRWCTDARGASVEVRAAGQAAPPVRPSRRRSPSRASRRRRRASLQPRGARRSRNAPTAPPRCFARCAPVGVPSLGVAERWTSCSRSSKPLSISGANWSSSRETRESARPLSPMPS